jgi:hypothetical protein
MVDIKTSDELKGLTFMKIKDTGLWELTFEYDESLIEINFDDEDLERLRKVIN